MVYHVSTQVRCGFHAFDQEEIAFPQWALEPWYSAEAPEHNMSRRQAALGKKTVTFRPTTFYETLDYLARDIRQAVENMGLNLDMEISFTFCLDLEIVWREQIVKIKAKECLAVRWQYWAWYLDGTGLLLSKSSTIIVMPGFLFASPLTRKSWVVLGFILFLGFPAGHVWVKKIESWCHFSSPRIRRALVSSCVFPLSGVLGGWGSCEEE